MTNLMFYFWFIISAQRKNDINKLFNFLQNSNIFYI